MKKVASVLALLTVAACGSDSNVTGPVFDSTVPVVSGRYSSWDDGLLVQWARQRDGVMGSFTCQATLTLSQGSAAGGQAALTGFLVFGSPCPPQNFDVTGVVNPDGAIRFTSSGPKPPEGQCPAAPDIEYVGTVSGDARTSGSLSARASANIDCPGPGEGPQRMDYILTLYKDN